MSDPTADNIHHEADAVDAGADEEKWPIGFILTIVMVGGYLAYRLVQGIVLFFQWIF